MQMTVEPHILERQILILAVQNADLRLALAEIEAVAVGKALATKKARAIAAIVRRTLTSVQST